MSDSSDLTNAEVCRLAERTLKALGIEKDEGVGQVLMLVARVAGTGILSRRVKEIAADSDVFICEKQVRRILEDPRNCFWTVDDDPEPPRRRGKRAKIKLIQIRVEECETITSNHEKRVATHSGKKSHSHKIELGTSTGHLKDIDVTSAGHEADISRTSRRHLEPYTVPSSLNPKPYGPPSPIETGDGGSMEDRKKIKGSADRESIETTVDAITPTARRLWRSLKFPPGNLETLWRVAAAFDAGLIPEHAIADAAAAAVACASSSPVGYFRRTLAEKLSIELEDLKPFLRRVRCRGGYPTEPPPRIATPIHARTRAVPLAPVERRLDELERQILDADKCTRPTVGNSHGGLKPANL